MTWYHVHYTTAEQPADDGYASAFVQAESFDAAAEKVRTACTLAQPAGALAITVRAVALLDCEVLL